jgi:hypothetical protein
LRVTVLYIYITPSQYLLTIEFIWESEGNPMQTLMNIAFGAALAGVSLGPAAWADVAQVNGRLLHAASLFAGAEEAGSPLNHAVARARAALPDLPHGAH